MISTKAPDTVFSKNRGTGAFLRSLSGGGKPAWFAGNPICTDHTPKAVRGCMNRQRTWKEYRAIDLALLGLALAVFEFLIVRAANWWFPDQPFTV